MGAIQDELNRRVAVAFSTDMFGIEVIYNTTPDVLAMFERMDSPEVESSRDRMADQAELWVMCSQVPSWSYDDIVQINGESWRVKRGLPGCDDFKHVLLIEKNLRRTW